MKLAQSLEELQRLFAGRYRLSSQLGNGGFGVVYEAEQIATGQLVALKVLNQISELPAMEQQNRNGRFLREVAVCARLNHPHIVRLLDGGELSNGALFAAFALIPGYDLHTFLAKKGAIALDECVRLMAQILDGLALAHDLGIVHRDLKPANIMVSTNGVRPHATILDFGIGALLDQTYAEGASRLTAQGTIIGTPCYSAPEQLCGAAPTPRSDLYAWGLLFLECITGKRVISGATPAEMCAQQCSSEPIPIPSQLANHPLGLLLTKVTQKDVTKRTLSARQVLTELYRIDTSTIGHILESAANVSTLANAFGTAHTDGERRQITALVALCDFEEEHNLSLEELATLFEWLSSTYQALARRFRAYIAGVVANRALFLFGYPRANEDDAARAAQAALVCIDLLDQLPERLRCVSGNGRIRIGISTGLAVLRSREDNRLDVAGQVILAADALATRAKPQQILISETTSEIIGTRYELCRCDAADHADASVGITAFSLESRRPCATIAPSSFSRPLANLVGREHELALLRERWQQCLLGSGKGILLKGEAGVGKSRLARELLVEAARDGKVVELDCTSEDQGRPFHPIIGLIDQLINSEGNSDPNERLTRLEELFRAHGMDASLCVRLIAPILSLPRPREETLDLASAKVREQTLEILCDLMLELSRDSPLLLLVEDLQWSDASTLALLDRLCGFASEAHLLVLMTARTELVWSIPSVWQLELEPLIRAHVKAMLEDLVKVTVADSLVDEVVARTGGICLFIEELGSTILGSGALAHLERGVAIEHLPELLLPVRLRDLLAMRLDAVGTARATAQLAAVIGREFSLDVLAAISPLPYDMLRRDLNVLREADLIRDSRRRVSGQYVFKHALIRDAAYDGLVTSTRQLAHGNIADVLEHSYPGLAEERPELMAIHHSRAGRYATAIEYAVKAAGAALKRSANEEARTTALEAEKWLTHVTNRDDRIRLELALNGVALPALMACWRWTDSAVKEKAERSLQLLERAGASPAQAGILWALGIYYMMLADREKCRAVAERQLQLAQLLADEGMQAAAQNSLSGTLMDEGDFEQALAVAESTLALYDPVKHANHAVVYGLHTHALARMFRSLALCHMGRFHLSFAEAELAEQEALQARHSATRVLALFYRALTQALAEDRARTHEFCSQGIEIAKKHGHGAQLGYFACLEAWSQRDLSAIRGAVGALEQSGQGLALSFYQSLWAEVEAESGYPDRALEITLRSLARSRSTGNASYLAVGLSNLAGYRLELDPNAMAAAEELLIEAQTLARSQSALLQELKAVARLSQLRFATGRRSEAVDLLNGYLESISSEPGVPIVDRVQGLWRQMTSCS